MANIFIFSCISDHSANDACEVYAMSSFLSTENLLSKSSPRKFLADLNQKSQDIPSQPRLAAYPIDQKIHHFKKSDIRTVLAWSIQ